MKIGGVELTGPSEEVLVLPRPLGDDIIIRCKAVLDMAPFLAMCPEPKAKPILVKGGYKKNTKDPNYLALCAKHSEHRFAYIALKSMEPSEIEWETVNPADCNTWLNWETELRAAGCSSIEINRIIMCVMQANSLDEEKLEKARADFLRGMEVPQEKSSGPRIEPPNTPSGEPAKDSE
jgi:hypothetical protein